MISMGKKFLSYLIHTSRHTCSADNLCNGTNHGNTLMCCVCRCVLRLSVSQVEVSETNLVEISSKLITYQKVLLFDIRSDTYYVV